MPSTDFLFFDDVQSLSGGAAYGGGASESDFVAGSPDDAQYIDCATVGSTVRMGGISNSGIPSGAIIVGYEFRVCTRANSGNVTFTIQPGRSLQGTYESMGTATTANHLSSVGIAYVNHVVGGATDMHGLGTLMSLPSNLNLLVFDFETTVNANGNIFRFQSAVDDGAPVALESPTVRIHYSVTEVSKWNSIAINSNSAAAGTAPDDVGNESGGEIVTMDGQGRTTLWSPSNGGGSQGSNNLTGWVNGSGAVNGTYWKTSGNSDTPSIELNKNIARWGCGPSSSGNGTGSSNTGPRGGANTSSVTPASGTLTEGMDTSVSDTNSRFLYCETSANAGGQSGSSNTKQFIFRSKAINWNQSMNDTSNTLMLSFFLYAFKGNCGCLSIYIDDTATSNDASATWLANVETRHVNNVSGFSRGKTRARVYTGTDGVYGGPGASSSQYGGYNTGTENEWSNYQISGNGGVNSSTTLWRKIQIEIPSTFRTTNDDYYLYFVVQPQTYTTNASLMETGETGLSSSITYQGDLSLDNIKTTELSPSLFAKLLNKHGTASTNTSEINLTPVP